MPRMPWKKAAKELGMSGNDLYRGLVEGRYPGTRVGGPRGRWIVDTSLVQARMEALMLANVKETYAAEPARIRQVQQR